jgi:hypothetical protein
MTARLLIVADTPEELAAAWDAMAGQVGAGAITTRVDTEGLHLLIDLRDQQPRPLRSPHHPAVVAAPAPAPEPEPAPEPPTPEPAVSHPQPLLVVQADYQAEVIPLTPADDEADRDAEDRCWTCADAVLAMLRAEPGVAMTLDDIDAAMADVTGGITWPRPTLTQTLATLCRAEKISKVGRGTFQF